jgi:hypothetical protein
MYDWESAGTSPNADDDGHGQRATQECKRPVGRLCVMLNTFLEPTRRARDAGGPLVRYLVGGAVILMAVLLLLRGDDRPSLHPVNVQARALRTPVR